ncbi:MAG: hypothetical protein JSS90_11560 [Bacteroidetes bacterium]|jgi:hypothetical protein|nr:hypothetical protein [Bacteroidota bacterium]
MKSKSKLIIILLSAVIIVFNSTVSYAAKRQESDVNFKPHCNPFSCCSYSFFGATVSVNVVSGKICFESAGSRMGNKDGAISVIIQLKNVKMESGKLVVKEDNILRDEETNESYLVKKGQYDVDEEGNCNLFIYKQD